MESQFVYSERLGIPVPRLAADWDELSLDMQAAVLEQWEMIRGVIPERVIRLEAQIRIKQDRLFEEEDFAASCRLNGDIADLASRINDLHIWFRTQQDLDMGTKRHG
ncbi:hypothetical protein SD71_04210 [Cohnella kolymensis]|uniref:Serine hydroxymethyltransferase n=1 Tax=Cohnella kolymensis TaxID=1590652 RepID=A0ABR5A8Q8_9BACL|nr:hypothetical protein SD71_04210 [Cohnella kolymensis]